MAHHDNGLPDEVRLDAASSLVFLFVVAGVSLLIIGLAVLAVLFFIAQIAPMAPG